MRYWSYFYLSTDDAEIGQGYLPGYLPGYIPGVISRVFALRKQTHTYELVGAAAAAPDCLGQEEIQPANGSSPSSTLGYATAVDTHRLGWGGGALVSCAGYYSNILITITMKQSLCKHQIFWLLVDEIREAWFRTCFV